MPTQEDLERRLDSLADWTNRPTVEAASAVGLTAPDAAGEGAVKTVKTVQAVKKVKTGKTGKTGKTVRTQAADAREPMPWDEIAAGASRQFNMRMDATLYAKLKYLGDTTYNSDMTKIVHEALRPVVDQLLKERNIT